MAKVRHGDEYNYLNPIVGKESSKQEILRFTQDDEKGMNG